ncbi:hypothetical protein PIB30_058598 [Stylosanthes scabra]|uniref:Uncharacterized protein n=1 Tax=Stylosanthes scabra TaxID=79078 RepID=A0ABU6VII3_9FABA|nr:hypothetical protein [Stylosanthes scabra]
MGDRLVVASAISGLAQFMGNPVCQVFEVAQANDPSPSADFLRWWLLAGKRYLVSADALHQLPPDEIPFEATQRQTASHPQWSQVADVPDNRRPTRRMMVGMRTRTRDW